MSAESSGFLVLAPSHSNNPIGRGGSPFAVGGVNMECRTGKLAHMASVPVLSWHNSGLPPAPSELKEVFAL